MTYSLQVVISQTGHSPTSRPLPYTQSRATNTLARTNTLALGPRSYGEYTRMYCIYTTHINDTTHVNDTNTHRQREEKLRPRR